VVTLQCCCTNDGCSSHNVAPMITVPAANHYHRISGGDEGGLASLLNRRKGSPAQMRRSEFREVVYMESLSLSISRISIRSVTDCEDITWLEIRMMRMAWVCR
jgi:hypothetical protein